MDSLLVTVPEAARALGLGESKTKELIRTGLLPSVKLGKSRRITTLALREFVERLQQVNQAATTIERVGQ
jgi:excisionase family DNA binding protein